MKQVTIILPLGNRFIQLIKIGEVISSEFNYSGSESPNTVWGGETCIHVLKLIDR